MCYYINDFCLFEPDKTKKYDCKLTGCSVSKTYHLHRKNMIDYNCYSVKLMLSLNFYYFFCSAGGV